MPDFWGVVFPNYISAFGGLTATVLAVVSLVLAESARRRGRATEKNELATREALGLALTAIEVQQSASESTATLLPDDDEPDVEMAREYLDAARARLAERG